MTRSAHTPDFFLADESPPTEDRSSSLADGGALRERQRVRGENADADTVRRRALDDRRGTLHSRIVTRTDSFRLVWSVRGRIDQVDILRGGVRLHTVRPSAALSWIFGYVSRRK